MRNILIALLILASGMTASATSPIFDPIIATVEGSQEGLIRVTLLQSGLVYSTNNKGVYKQTRLSPAATKLVLNLARSVADVELKETQRNMVCKMLRLPSLIDLQVSGIDSESQQFNGDLRLVLTATDCSTSYVVYPIEANAKARAEQLRAHLVLLGLNTLQ